MISINRRGLGLAATFGFSALLIGLAAAAPARADDFDRYGRNHVYRDIADVRRDEALLRDLQYQHDEARRCHDWSRMHAIDRQIADLRCHIDEDRRDIHRDVNRDRADYHTRDRYRNDSGYSNYRNRDSRDYSGYRNRDSRDYSTYRSRDDQYKYGDPDRFNR
jgi:hypothetical protein